MDHAVLGSRYLAEVRCIRLLSGRRGNSIWARPVCHATEMMRKEYDCSTGRRNPYARQLEQSVTMRVDRTTLGYFKGLASELRQ